MWYTYFRHSISYWNIVAKAFVSLILSGMIPSGMLHFLLFVYFRVSFVLQLSYFFFSSSTSIVRVGHNSNAGDN